MLGSARQLILWVTFALITSALLMGVLQWERRHGPTRWSALPIGSPREGEKLFQKKGCARCHAVSGIGGTSGPDLGSGRSSRSRPDQLVIAMWNHAPRMWERMRAEGIEYPALEAQEMADVFAYLYTARSVDEAGDPARGRELYEAKGCGTCHSVQGNATASKARSVESFREEASPVAWATAMWNHPPLSGAGGERLRFEGAEMNDLLAYARGNRSTSPERRLLDADPDRGWALFREKSCISCHPLENDKGEVGVQLGPGRTLPPTIVQLSGTMWNHSEGMSQAMRDRGVTRPVFDAREMGDIIAFLYSFRAAEPGGSTRLGEVLYVGRGCSRCHGPKAEGTSLGPRLRGGGRSYTSVSFATALWRHGPRMYERARQLGLEWPSLIEGDVGDLITFLKSSPEGRS
ncbi:MAG: c-type cytochrome [Thermoanaerobaculia bacterium]